MCPISEASPRTMLRGVGNTLLLFVCVAVVSAALLGGTWLFALLFVKAIGGIASH
jgi:hypothetical protein